MHQATPDLILESPPDGALIDQLREQAREAGASVIAAFDDAQQQPLYLIISDRGTCVLLDKHVTIQTFNRELDADQVAEALVA